MQKDLIRLGVLAAALSLGQTAIADNSHHSKPNVIIFMADDLGQDATRLYNPDDSDLVQARRDLGNEFPENAPMPALEKLATRGVTFQHAWAMPVCSTTRAARSTGLYASTTGVGQVIGQFTPRFGAAGTPFDGVEFPPSILHPDHPDMLQRLVKQAGYATYKFGKWHEVEVDFTGKVWDSYDLTDGVAASLATQGLDDVHRSGFDEFYGLLSGRFGGINGNGYGGGEVSIDDQPTGAKLDDGETDAIHMIDSRSTRVTDGYLDARSPTCEFADSAMVTRAITLIEEAKYTGKPYFMEFDALGPHFQYEVPPGPWDTEQDARERGCFNGEHGEWKTLKKDVHKEVIVQIIAAFNDLDDTTVPTVDEVRGDLEAYKHLYPEVGTRAPGPPPSAAAGDVAKRRAAFKGLLSYMDMQMGRLLKHVDMDNTYVVFVGDNGTQGGGPVFSVIEPPNDTTRSKATVYRNGREVPMVFYGPHGAMGVLDENSLVNTTDLYATVLDLIGVSQPDNTKASSYSFAGALDGDTSKRKVNVSEIFPATATVGGLNPIGSGAPGPFGSGSRAIADDRFSLIAFNSIDANNLFICKPNSTALPEEDCLNHATGIYEHAVDLEFYDLEVDPLEENSLLIADMSGDQLAAFSQLCAVMNKLSKKATYYMNGEHVCKPNGAHLR